MNEILVAIGGGLAGAKVLEKFLGPTAEYLGEGMLTLVKKRAETFQRIFAKGEARLGDRINSPGAVPPRVLAGILNDGSYREDSVSIEYYGGVLASSRTPISRDDRAATFVNLVSRLSTYQLRLHYIIYGVMLKLYGGLGVGLGMEHDRNALRTLFLNHPLPSQWISPKKKIRMRFFYTQCKALFENHSSIRLLDWAIRMPRGL
jgi:hypothetical protein